MNKHEPTELDILFDEFRKLFPYHRCFVGESEMIYTYRDKGVLLTSAELANKIIQGNGFPLKAFADTERIVSSLPYSLKITFDIEKKYNRLEKENSKLKNIISELNEQQDHDTINFTTGFED